ncbi:MAG: hypothetical protein KKD44_17520 [Proteobacteria bacterium]|nr:hypothetical protein [Pseudomonadota bacterium]
MNPRSSIISIMLFLFLGVNLCEAGQDTIRLTLSSGEEARIEYGSDGGWEYRQGGEIYGLEKDQAGVLVFNKGYQMIATGRFKGDKLDMATGTGDGFLFVKVTADKIKFGASSTTMSWEFKIKPDKIKIVYGSMEYGKVKYYPDTGKIKAKDKSDKTVAEIKDSKGLTAAPGAFLVDDFSQDKAVFLCLLVLSLGK